MAVSTQKLLPGSKSSALAIRTSKITILSQNKEKKGGSLVKSESGALSKEILQMKKNVLKLQGSINKNDKADKKETDDKRKSSEKEERVKRERKFESRNLNLKGINLPNVAANLPGGSLVDMIKRYLGFTFLGWLVGRYDQLMPKLEKFMGMAKSVFNGLVFTIDAVSKGIFGFVDAGYKAYDKISSGIKSLGGVNAEKTFGDFSSHFNKLLNGAIVAAMLLMSTSPKNPKGTTGPSGAMGGGRGSGRSPGSVKSLPPSSGSRSPGQARAGGFALEQARKKATQTSLASSAKPAAKVGKFGKFGGGRIPIIGPLITLGIRTIIYKEPLAKAATAAVGMGIGQAIGTFIGGLGAGALGLGTLGLGAVVAPLIIGAGSIIGGLIGEWIGAALYDFLAASSGKNNKGAKKASGGNVTSPQSSPKPTFRKKVKTTAKRNKVVAQKTQPGKDIGGRYRIENIYGKERVKPKDPKDTTTRGQVIVKQLEMSSSEIKRLPIDWIASLGGAFMDLALGQKPDKKVSRDIAKSFGIYTENIAGEKISLTVDSITKSLIGMVNGGSVPESLSLEEKKDLGQKVERSIEQRLENILNQASSITFRNLGRPQSVKKNIEEIQEMQRRSRERQGLGSGGGGGAGGYASGSENFVPSHEIYSYLKSKGLSHIHILGMLANIQAESSFDSGAIGDGGDSGGLFQHNTSRFEGMKSYAGKNWARNWKRQVDYALREGAGQQYANKEFKNAEEASAWFTLNFERPSNKEYKAAQRLENLKNFGADGSWRGGAQPGVRGRPGKIEALSKGFRTGLVTGPAGRIGAGTGYHVDGRFMHNIPLKDKIAMLDAMASAHAQEGFVMEFSGTNVAGRRWNPGMSIKEKEEFAKKVLASHHEDRFPWQAFDYFIVKKSAKDRGHESAQGSNIMAPILKDGSYEYQEGGGMGRHLIIRDKNGNEVMRILHGDTGVPNAKELGKSFNMNQLSEAQQELKAMEMERKTREALSTMTSQRQITQALSRKGAIPITFNGKKVFFRVNVDGSVSAYKPKNIFGYQEPIDVSGNKNIALRRAINEKVKTMYRGKSNTSSPKVLPQTLPNRLSGGTLESLRQSGLLTQPARKPAKPKRWALDPRGWFGMEGGGSVSSNQSSKYSSLNRSGSLKTETSYNEQVVVMVQREIVMT